MCKYIKKILDISGGAEIIKKYFSESGELKSENLILEMLSRNESFFYFREVSLLMKTLYEKVHMFLLNKDINYLEYIKNPSLDFISKVIEINGLSIQYFPNISEELKLKAIHQNPLAISGRIF